MSPIFLFILPYDPFNRNRMVYTIRNQCVEDAHVNYNDGATKILLYTKGCEGNPSQELRDMLKYIEASTDENVTNQDIDSLHRLVGKVKSRREVGINYMKSWELEQMHREEGIEQGIRQGIEQGIQVLIATCREFNLSREETTDRVISSFSVSKEDAEHYIDEYF